MSIKQDLSGSIALTKMPQVSLYKTKKGTECLLIPIDSNNLVRGKEGAVYMNIKVHVTGEEDQFGNHGFIGFSPKKINGKTYKETEDKEFWKKMSPILGNVRDYEFVRASDGPSDTNVYNEESEDLPF